MTQKIKISIPKPCHENWLEMSVTEKGRFCANCQKDVIDFTSCSDKEILKYYNQNSKICGRFTVNQLNRDLIVPEEKSSIWMLIATFSITLLGIGTQEVRGQEAVKSEQTANKKNDSSKSYQSTIMLGDEITGTVNDSINPLPAAIIENSRTKIKTNTDFDGNFKIKAQKGDEIIITYLGMKTYNFTADDSTHYTVNMLLDPTNPPQEIIVGGAVAVKRNFWHKLFHKN